jgi:hypothetical protein
LHLLTNTTTTTPTDLWLPSSNNVKAQIADQVSLGYFRNLSNNEYELSLETYYKDLQNQIDYKNGADLVLIQRWRPNWCLAGDGLTVLNCC